VAFLSKPAARPSGRGKSRPATVWASTGSSTTRNRRSSFRITGTWDARDSQRFIRTWIRSGRSRNMTLRLAS